MFLNDTSCNLASLNLMKFVDADGEFDVEAFRYAARVTITAQEILVDNASYPTPRIEENSHRFRPLGHGLREPRRAAHEPRPRLRLRRGSRLCGRHHGDHDRRGAIASRRSIARDHGGPFIDYPVNEEPFLRVIGKHRDAAYADPVEDWRRRPARRRTPSWDEALELGKQHGYRNAQVTVLAPTGTIAFMMDCDTTGIEPDIALIKYKKLVGEGFLKIVNETVPAALRKLGYSPDEVEAIVAYIDEHETIEGAPALQPEHLTVFDCAFKPVNGERSIHHMGHVRMMGAVQPFLSRRDQQDRQHARGRHGRGHRGRLPPGLEAGPQGHRDLPRRLQAQPAALDRQEEGRRRGQSRPSDGGCGAGARGLSWGAQAIPAPPAGRADGGHPQVPGRRPRGLHHRRASTPTASPARSS